MPDPIRKSISATEAPALFDVSPYVTRWMLYRRFANGEEVFANENSRMDWGKKLEPLVIAQAASDLKFEVRPNLGPDGKQLYVRNGLLGCTRDAEVFCPDRGPGALETKCVFDYATWMREWGGGNNPPRHHEIQLQQQMKVGDGKTSYKWGVEAVWIAGEVIYFKRDPIPRFWDALEMEAERFFADVAAGREPEPFGSPIENPLLNEVFHIDPEKVIDRREDPEAIKIAEDVRQLEYHAKQRLGHERAEKALKAKFRGLVRDAGKLLLPNGISISAKTVNRAGYTAKPSSFVQIDTHVPDDIREGALGNE